MLLTIFGFMFNGFALASTISDFFLMRVVPRMGGRERPRWVARRSDYGWVLAAQESRWKRG